MQVTVLEATAMLTLYALFIAYIAFFDRAGARAGVDCLHIQVHTTKHAPCHVQRSLAWLHLLGLPGMVAKLDDSDG
jgi:hypothetical protein